MKNQKKVFQSLTLILQFGLNMIVPIVLCMMFGIWLGRKYDILWITIPFFGHRGNWRVSPIFTRWQKDLWIRQKR